MSWLSGWVHRVKIPVNATSAGEQTGYQMRLVVNYGSGSNSAGSIYCNGHCKPDFRDIRFTEDDGVTLVDYWVEYKVDEGFAVIWVKLPFISSSGTVDYYVYYGALGDVSSVSSGVDTWVWFEEWSSDHRGDYAEYDRYTADWSWFKSFSSSIPFRHLSKFKITNWSYGGFGGITSIGLSKEGNTWNPDNRVTWQIGDDTDWGSPDSSHLLFRVSSRKDGVASNSNWDLVSFSLNTYYVFELTASSSKITAKMKEVDGTVKSTREVTTNIPTDVDYQMYHEYNAGDSGAIKEWGYDSSSGELVWGHHRGTLSQCVGRTPWTCFGKFVDPEPSWAAPGSEEKHPFRMVMMGGLQWF